MKTIQNLILLATTSLATTAGASIWIETPFWKAPQATNFEIGLTGKSKLDSECAIYRKAVFNSDGTLTSIAHNKERLERFRKPINPIVLELDIRPWEKIEKVVTVTDEPAKSEKLPYHYQSTAKTGLLLADVSEVKVTGFKNSFVDVSRQQRLDDTDVEFFQDHNGRFVLNIPGRDVACDLYEGTGFISLKAPTYVVLGEEGARKIQDFYNERLLPEVADVVLSNSEAPIHKAARVGFRAGKILEDEFPAHKAKDSEAQLVEVMKTLFNMKTLAPSRRLLNSGKQLLVNFDESAEGSDVFVKVRF